MEFWGEGLEVCVFCEFSLAFEEVALGFGLEVDLRRAEWVFFGNEIVFVYGF